MARGLHCDVAIVGGGLAGGLIALALHHHRPELDVRLIESAQTLGGNHVWSYFASDVDAMGERLLAPLSCHQWDGYEVRFPAHQRTLATRYHSIRSERFDTVVRATLRPERVMLGAKTIGVSPSAVVLESGERIEAGGTIDCRGPGDLSLLDCGWQKFAGHELELEEPHGIDRPVVMDATVEQIDGYRFVYLLPFTRTRLFVEDTYYSDGPTLDLPAIEERIASYAAAKGWKIAQIRAREQGVLPVAIGGDFDGYWRSGGKAAKAGMRAGLFHPTTGYSLPDAVRTAHFVASLQSFDGTALEEALRIYARERWNERGFYRKLDAMMFRGAGTGERHRILERFYTLDAGLIERFYACRSTLKDKARLVSGKPPIPIGRGLKVLWETRTR